MGQGPIGDRRGNLRLRKPGVICLAPYPLSGRDLTGTDQRFGPPSVSQLFADQESQCPVTAVGALKIAQLPQPSVLGVKNPHFMQG